MSSNRIVTGVLATVETGSGTLTYLLTNGAYHDPALASSIVDGVAKVVIPSDASFDITEEISFQPQGGSSGTSIGSIPIDNTGGDFDDWYGYTFAGADLEWTVRRGYSDQPWADWASLFENGRARGRPEFSGQRIIVSLTDRFGYMREPVAQSVFPDTTPNESLIKRLKPMVFGEAYQVRPALENPAALAYFAADNLAQVFSVAEGGNPATPQWVATGEGVQLTAAPSLVVTTDIAGPPAVNPDESPDVLGGQGEFSSWTSGALDYPDLTVTESTNATITEGSNSDTGVLNILPSQSFNTGFNGGSTPLVRYDEIRFDTIGGPNLPSGAIVTGIEINVTARWQRVSGSPIARESISSLGIVLPNGLVFGAEPSDNELDEYYKNYTVGGFGNLLGAPLNELAYSVINSSDFGVRVKSNLKSYQQLVVSSAKIKIYYVEQEQYVRLLWADVLEVGQRYTISIDTVGSESPEDSVLADWTDSVDSDAPQSAVRAQVAGTDTHSYVFTAGQTDLDMYFYRGFGNGDQEINSIIVRKGASAQNRYYDLIRYIHSSAGEDPDVVCDRDSLQLLPAQADNPRLGWYVNDATTREQLSTFLSHSLAGVTWGGIDGLWKAAQLRVPEQQVGQPYLMVNNCFDQPSAVADYADDLRDRVAAARNFYPIPESEAAGITSSWDREDREQIQAKYRITEEVDFDNLTDYTGTNLVIDFIGENGGPDTYLFSANEGITAGTVVGTVYAIGDFPPFVFSITSGNGAGLFAIDSSTGEISVTQTIDDADLGAYSLGLQVEDDQTNTDTATVNIQLINVNEAPVIGAIPNPTYNEGDTVNWDLSAYVSDPDVGDTFTYDLLPEAVSFPPPVLPPGLSFDPYSAVVSGTIGYDAMTPPLYGERYRFRLRVIDSGGLSAISGPFSTLWTINDVYDYRYTDFAKYFIQNFVLQSQDLDEAVWNKTNLETVTYAPKNVATPAGAVATVPFWSITPTSTNGLHTIDQSVTLTEDGKMSFTLGSNGYERVKVEGVDTGTAVRFSFVVNVATGTVSDETNITAEAEQPYTDSTVLKVTAEYTGATGIDSLVFTVLDQNGNDTFAGVGSAGILLTWVQAGEYNAIYTRTTTTAVDTDNLDSEWTEYGATGVWEVSPVGGYPAMVRDSSANETNVLILHDDSFLTDGGVLVKFDAYDDEGGNRPSFVFRSANDHNSLSYRIQISGGNFRLLKSVSYVNTVIDSVAFSFTEGDTVWAFVKFIGTSIEATIWHEGDSIPGSPTLTATDSDATSGKAGVLSNPATYDQNIYFFAYGPNLDVAEAITQTGSGEEHP